MRVVILSAPESERYIAVRLPEIVNHPFWTVWQWVPDDEQLLRHGKRRRRHPEHTKDEVASDFPSSSA